MLIPLGVLAASGAGPVGGDYELIETTILGSSAASVTFSSLATYASTYKHLQVRVVTRNSRAAEWSGISFRFNADSGTNYSSHFLKGDGVSVSSSATANSNAISNGSLEVAGSGNSADIFSGIIYDILDPYSTAKNKTVRYFGGRGAVSSGDKQILLASGAWRDLSSVTEISLTANPDGNFVAGSRFSLYGIKG